MVAAASHHRSDSTQCIHSIHRGLSPGTSDLRPVLGCLWPSRAQMYLLFPECWYPHGRVAVEYSPAFDNQVGFPLRCKAAGRAEQSRAGLHTTIRRLSSLVHVGLSVIRAKRYPMPDVTSPKITALRARPCLSACPQDNNVVIWSHVSQ